MSAFSRGHRSWLSIRVASRRGVSTSESDTGMLLGAHVPGGFGSYAEELRRQRVDGGTGRAAPWVVDVALAVVVTIVLSVIIVLSQAGTGVSPNVMAYVFAAGFGAVLMLRRSMPIPVLVLSVLGTFAYYTLEYPPIGVAVPVVAALYSAGEAGLIRWAVGAGVVVFAVSLYFRLRDDPQPVGYVLGTDSVSNIALIAAAIALGYGIRARRLRAAQQEQIARLTEAQLAREAESRVQGERERISRELHDTIGHALSVIALHASVGTEAVGHDDRAVATALDHVRSQSTKSLQELRSMVRVLRTDAAGDDETRKVRSLTDVQTVLDQARAAGVDVTAAIDITADDLPAAVDTAGYRVIQESVTNIIRHAHATNARVSAVIEAGRLHITVTDDGDGAADDRTDGYGISGMTERVRLLGGSVVTRSAPGAGFSVQAMIPAKLVS
jgi:signal transduction histidine kinase